MTTLTATRPSTTRPLLIAAAIAGPFFYTVAIAQMLTRDGFDLRVHPISQLATGSLGWIQMISFVLTGLGVIALAVACIVLVVDAVRRRAVRAAVGHGVVALVMLIPVSPIGASVQIALTGAVAFTWTTGYAVQLSSRRTR